MKTLADQFGAFARTIPMPLGCKPARKSLLDDLRALPRDACEDGSYWVRAELIEELIARHAAP